MVIYDSAQGRRSAILQILKDDSSVNVSELSKRFGVSEVTIRKDLRILKERKLLVRVHGGAILGAYTGTLGYIGSKSGLSFDLLAQRSFGRTGSFLPSALIAFTQIGWFGVGVAMFALPAADVLHVHPAVLVALAGACMTASAYFGIRGMEIVSYVSDRKSVV